MRLVTNSVSPNQVRETDSAYIIEDVPFVRPMELSGGYVPRQNIKETARMWDGVPATLNHPRNKSGAPVAASSQPKTHLGVVQNTSFDGEFARAGEIRLEKQELRNTDGAEEVEKALENGEPISVSSQYAAAPAEAGEYDGEYRDNVERIIRPDSVAILPNQPGKCSIQDGCGINPQMAANSDLTIPMTHPEADGEVAVTQNMDVPAKYQYDNPGEAASAAEELGFEGSGDELIHTHGDGDDTVFMPGPSHEQLVSTLEEMDEMSSNQMDLELTDIDVSDISSFTDSEWDGSAATAAMPNPSEEDGAADVLDMAHLVRPVGEEARQEKANWKLPFREGPDASANTRALVAAKAAVEGARGGVDGLSSDLEERIIEKIDDMLVAAPEDMFGSMSEDMESESGHMEMEGNVLNRVANAVAGVLGGGGTSAAESDSEETTPAESGTDTNSEMQDQDKIDALAANTAFDRENLVKWDGTDCLAQLYENHIEANNMSDSDPAVTFDTREEFESAVAEIVANREAQSKKEELASDIVANSAEYDDTDAVTEDYPTVKALETKKESLESTGPAMPGFGKQTANTGGSEDEFPDMEIGGDF